MRLWLIRHGATAATAAGRYCGHGDPPLAPEGVAQARALAAVVPSGLALWSSDLSRARATAALAFAREPRVSRDFRELDFGRFEGLTAADCAAGWPDAYAAFVARPWDCGPPGGETLAQLAARAQRGLARVRAESTGDVALVAHAGALKMLLLHALDLPLSAVYAFHLAPGAASLLELWDGGATLRALNIGVPASALAPIAPRA